MICKKNFIEKIERDAEFMINTKQNRIDHLEEMLDHLEEDREI